MIESKNTALPQILLIDDDTELLKSASLLLRNTYRVLTASSVATGKAVFRSQAVDVVVVDLCFEGQEADGLDFIDWISREKPKTPVIVLSGDTRTQRVVAATRRRLVDFIPKSADYEMDLRRAIQKGLELQNAQKAAQGEHPFLTRSPAVQRILDQVDRIALSGVQCNILITGETGSGKEELAKLLAARLKKKMVAANMASIPKETAESELFGHTKGSFTGATADKAGLILQAHNGIFFLDELGECPPAIQAKLLRVIQEQEIQPLGAVQTRKVNIRFIAATNRDLSAMAARQEFREDLLHRVNAVTLHLPPLRERPEDIEYYATLFLEDLSGGKPFPIKASGLAALLKHPWPGNVRELRNVIENIVIFSDRRELDEENVLRVLNRTHDGGSEARDDVPAYAELARERSTLLGALERSGGNRAHAAKALGVHRTTITRRMRDLGIGNAIRGRAGRPAAPKGGVA